jgi:hypothetical protein
MCVPRYRADQKPGLEEQRRAPRFLRRPVRDGRPTLKINSALASFSTTEGSIREVESRRVRLQFRPSANRGTENVANRVHEEIARFLHGCFAPVATRPVRSEQRVALGDVQFVQLSDHEALAGADAYHLAKAVISMGDKSPKAKDKSKKQHTADKDQKHAAAVQKAKPASPGPGKKGK